MRRPRESTGLAVLVGLVLAAGCTGSSSTSSLPAIAASDPWSAGQLIVPAQLDSLLKAPGPAKPLLLHVGFQVLFRGGAIPDSRYVGAGSTPEGLAGLRAAVQDEPRDRTVVLYCGCCPWGHCPNMRPAFRTLRGMGFTHALALYMPDNFQSDWADRGYPVLGPRN